MRKRRRVRNGQRNQERLSAIVSQTDREGELIEGSDVRKTRGSLHAGHYSRDEDKIHTIVNEPSQHTHMIVISVARWLTSGMRELALQRFEYLSDYKERKLVAQRLECRKATEV
ncbi:hypothetical protein FRC19_005239 [Serendipita sp. 401]|nr:hypothetical protein FRC16_009837 [Serendipita sp. 398]KAG8809404.1 hypothetical protein FRC19_005239 [Serendipita sp. 401]